MTYEKPNYTQVPNLLLDEHMQKMSKAELKIVLAACRKTFGWQKGKDRISYTQFEKLTGLSRASVQEGIKQAITHGVLRRYEVRNGFEYSLVMNVFPSIPEIEHTKESILKKHTAANSAKNFMDLALAQQKTVEFLPDVDDLLQVFIKKFGRVPGDAKEKKRWEAGAREWRGLGIRPDDVSRMYDHAKEQGMAVSSPYSIKFAYDEIRNQAELYKDLRAG